MNHFFTLVGAIACKVSHNSSSCNPSIARTTFYITFLDFGEWAALQTKETAVRTRRHCLDADKFPMFSGGRTWQGFCRDLDPYWFE